MPELPKDSNEPISVDRNPDLNEYLGPLIDDPAPELSDREVRNHRRYFDLDWFDL